MAHQPRPGAVVYRALSGRPDARLRDIAASVGITGRSAHAIVADLTQAGYVVKQKDGAATATRSRRTCRCLSPHPGTCYRRSPRRVAGIHQ